MKIKIFSIVGILSLSIMCVMTYSNNLKAESGLKSKGKLIYSISNSTEDIVIDSDDFRLLKNNIDAHTIQIASIEEYLSQSNTDKWEDENGVSVHEKLDELLSRAGANVSPVFITTLDCFTNGLSYTFVKDYSYVILFRMGYTDKWTTSVPYTTSVINTTNLNNWSNDGTYFDAASWCDLLEDVKAGDTITIETRTNMAGMAYLIGFE